jgi:heme exporter protein D
MERLFQIIQQKEAALGYSGSVVFFFMEHYEVVSGMLISLVMILSSIILQWKKIQSIENEERRREERHQQQIKQDQEIHERNIKNQNGT